MTPTQEYLWWDFLTEHSNVLPNPQLRSPPPAPFSMEYRKMLQDDGYERDDGTPTWSHSDSSVLLASKTGLYLLDSSMHVIRADVGTPYGIGCGGEYAMGAMAAYQQHGLTDVSKAMISACEVAYRFSAGCGGKVDVWRVGRAGEGKFIT